MLGRWEVSILDRLKQLMRQHRERDSPQWFQNKMNLLCEAWAKTTAEWAGAGFRGAAAGDGAARTGSIGAGAAGATCQQQRLLLKLLKLELEGLQLLELELLELELLEAAKQNNDNKNNNHPRLETFFHENVTVTNDNTQTQKLLHHPNPPALNTPEALKQNTN